MKVYELFEVEVRGLSSDKSSRRSTYGVNSFPVKRAAPKVDTKEVFKKECIYARGWYRMHIAPAVQLFLKQRLGGQKDMYGLQEFIEKKIVKDDPDNFLSNLDKIVKGNPELGKKLERLTIACKELDRISRHIHKKLLEWYGTVKPSKGSSYHTLIQYALDERQTSELDLCLQLGSWIRKMVKYFETNTAYSE